jgi:hypothetical protein
MLFGSLLQLSGDKFQFQQREGIICQTPETIFACM